MTGRTTGKQNSNAQHLDVQYLRAMNIDLWVSRDASETIHADTPGVTTAPTADNAVAVMAENKALSAMSPAELGAVLERMALGANQATAESRLLVITEDAPLSAECSQLLGAMFKAIEVESTQWLHAGISEAEADNAPTVATVCESAPVEGIVLMLRTGGDVQTLGQLRKVKVQASGLRPFVVVTFHPQDLLDNPEAKRPAWEDLKQLRQWLGR